MEVLSQKSIDDLLASTSEGAVESEDPEHIVDQHKIKIYDFRRPDKFTKESIRAISKIHDDFARLLTATLLRPIRAPFEAHIASIDQLTFEEFIRSVPNPTTATVFELRPLPGFGLLEIDPLLSQCLVDRQMGGSGTPKTARREHTEIERTILTGLVQNMLGSMEEAWSTVMPLRSRFVRMETNPMVATIVSREEMVVLVTLEVVIGQVTGMINICLPAIILDPILEDLRIQFPSRQFRGQKEPFGLGDYSEMEVVTQVFCPIQDLSFAEVAKLRKGTLIPIPDFPKLETYWEAGDCQMAQINLTTRTLILNRNLPSQSKPTAARRDDFNAALAELNGQPREPIVAGDASFTFLEEVEPGYFAEMLKPETPQTIALILSSLPPSVASSILAKMEKRTQVEVRNRISRMQGVSASVMSALATVLKKNLVGNENGIHSRRGGKDFLEQVLKQASN